MPAQHYNYGDTRLLAHGGDDRELANRLLTSAEASRWLPDVAIESSKGLPPFSYIRIELCVCGGQFPMWETKAAIQTRPMPGWAARGACYCKTCGVVAQDGAALSCNHNHSSEPY